MQAEKHLIIVTGPTAAGKTNVAIRLAAELGTEIISADSRQVYREMIVGTAAPSAEQLSQVKHHFIGHKSVCDDYNASMFEVEVIDLLGHLFRQKDQVIMAGGSGLYIDAVCRGIDDLPAIDPAVRQRLKSFYSEKGLGAIRKRLEKADPSYYRTADLQNPSRILKALEVYEMTGRPYSAFLKGLHKERNFKILKIGLDMDRKILYDRINKRVSDMISDGLIEEVRSLSAFRDRNALNTVGYKEVFQYLDGKISLNEAIDLIRRHTRQYARRQLTWFRKDIQIKWFTPDRIEEILHFISAKVDNQQDKGKQPVSSAVPYQTGRQRSDSKQH